MPYWYPFGWEQTPNCFIVLFNKRKKKYMRVIKTSRHITSSGLGSHMNTFIQISRRPETKFIYFVPFRVHRRWNISISILFFCILMWSHCSSHSKRNLHRKASWCRIYQVEETISLKIYRDQFLTNLKGVYFRSFYYVTCRNRRITTLQAYSLKCHCERYTLDKHTQ